MWKKKKIDCIRKTRYLKGKYCRNRCRDVECIKLYDVKNKSKSKCVKIKQTIGET